MTQQHIVTVSQVNEYIKAKMERDELLSFLCVRGEISNYKLYPSGHHYFSLKDAGGSLRCVMFKGSAVRLRFRPENGMKVLAFGRISVFPRDGAYQLYCEQLTPEGTGELFVAFEQLKRKLEQEGVFAQEHKRPIPAYPQRIAIVTSAAGAAIHDMLRILARRFPLSKVLLLPVRVQGVEAPAELCAAIRYVNAHKLADVIITGRGGGSMEDLWAFNDENLAYEIYRSEIPVISAVGHEPDVTISDYVADLRAATPSNAAELVVPDQADLRYQLRSAESRIHQAMQRQIKISAQRLERAKGSYVLRSPLNYLQERRLLADQKQKDMLQCLNRMVATKKQQYVKLAAALDAMSPLRVLSRGYSIVEANDRVLLDASEVQPGDTITITLNKGRIDADVRAVRGEENG